MPVSCNHVCSTQISVLLSVPVYTLHSCVYSDLRGGYSLAANGFGFLHHSLKFPLPVVLKVYSIDPQNQYHFQTCWKFTFSGPTLDLPDLKLWWNLALSILTSLPDDILMFSEVWESVSPFVNKSCSCILIWVCTYFLLNIFICSALSTHMWAFFILVLLCLQSSFLSPELSSTPI